ncbi:Polyamine aminopropyltransferase [bacterium HR11]|nr:Polyamine aminopropyltransferase [bacterium HR11]
MYPIILGIFFLSGALGLGYQVLWSKYLLDFIGVSAYSYATVLASFMGGLALGSWLLGRWADRWTVPLKLYAYLELGVGLYAIVYLPLREWVARLYAHWVRFTPEQAGAAVGLWAKVIVSGLLLLPPTILMGGTFPALVRHATESLQRVGRRASQLYAVNAFGAVAGTLLMAFLLMPTLGMRASLMVLALLNGWVALTALLLTRRGPAAVETETVGPSETESPVSVPDPGALPSLDTEHRPWYVRAGLILIFLEGFIAFAYEIAWTRFFGVVLGSSTYSFAVMLAAFITGIAVGSAVLARIERAIGNPLAFFGWTQVLAGLLVLLPLPLYPYIPWLFKQYASLFSNRLGAFYLYEFGKLLLCYLIMLPPTVFIGMALPLLVKGLSRRLASLGQDTGRVYAWNTWGNVLGALVAGTVLLPALGMERLIRWSAVGNGLLGLAAVALFSGPAPTVRRRWASALSAVLVVGLMAAYPFLTGPWDARWFTLQPFRRGAALSLAETRQGFQSQAVVLFRDDPAAHLMVVRFRPPPQTSGKDVKATNPNESGSYTLFVNGKPDASSFGDMPTQVLSAHIPLLLHPDPRDVLIIGLASGTTAGSALKHPVRRVDVVDIVGAMPQATRFFLPWNGNPFADPRFRLIVDDARSYLSYTRHSYDVIISEPSNPWMAGTGALFSVDFYRRATRALRPDGLYLQWLQAYEMGDPAFVAVVRSFRQVFPWVYGFQGNSKDVLLIGSRSPLRPRWDVLQARFERIRDHLKTLQIEDLATLLYFQRFSPATVDYIAALDDLENTDDNHLLEYRAPRDLFQRLGVVLPERFDERPTAAPTLFWNEYVRRHPQEVRPLATLPVLADGRIGYPGILRIFQMAVYHLHGPALRSSPEAARWFPPTFWLQAPLAGEALTEQVRTWLQQGLRPQAVRLMQEYAPVVLTVSVLSPEQATFWGPHLQAWAAEPELRRTYIEWLMATGRTEEAARELLGWVQSPSPPPAEWAVLRACQIDRTDLCRTVRDAALRRGPHPVLERLGEVGRWGVEE